MEITCIEKYYNKFIGCISIYRCLREAVVTRKLHFRNNRETIFSRTDYRLKHVITEYKKNLTSLTFSFIINTKIFAA